MDETRVENLYLGHATAYGYAKAKGYEGTEEEFAQLCADLGIDIEQLENMTVIINMLEPDADPSGTYSDGVLTLNLPRGVKGDTGESAYEYAVAGGYTGTEEEFQQLCADLGIEVDHLENMTVVVNMVAPSVQPSATYVDGTLTINIQSATAEQVSTATDAWLAQNITNPSNPPLDRSLTLANAAAPADLTGELKSAISSIEQVITNIVTNGTPTDTRTGYINANTGNYNTNSAYKTYDYNIPNGANTLTVTGANLSGSSSKPLALISFENALGTYDVVSTIDQYDGTEYTRTVYIPQGAVSAIISMSKSYATEHGVPVVTYGIIVNVKEEIENIKGDITDIENDVGNIEDDVNDIETEIGVIEQSLSGEVQKNSTSSWKGYVGTDGVYHTNSAYRTYFYNIPEGAISITATGANGTGSSAKNIGFISFLDDEEPPTVFQTIETIDANDDTEYTRTVNIPDGAVVARICMWKSYAVEHGSPVATFATISDVVDEAEVVQIIRDVQEEDISNVRKIDRLIFSEDIKNTFIPSVDILAEHPWDANNGVYSSITVSQVYELFDELVTEHSDELSMEVIGTASDDESELRVYRFNPKRGAGRIPYRIYRPKVMVNGATHGWEKCGTETILMFLKMIFDHWDANPLLEVLRWDVNWVFVPISNPWGFDNNQRKNANGVDLNRNYELGWKKRVVDPSSQTYQGESPLSEPESQAIDTLMELEKPDVGIDFHDFGSSNAKLNWVSAAAGTGGISIDAYHLAQVALDKVNRQLTKKFNFLSAVDPTSLLNLTVGTYPTGLTANAYYYHGVKFAYTLETCGQFTYEPNKKRFNDNHALMCIATFINFVSQNLQQLYRVMQTTEVIKESDDPDPEPDPDNPDD